MFTMEAGMTEEKKQNTLVRISERAKALLMARKAEGQGSILQQVDRLLGVEIPDEAA